MRLRFLFLPLVFLFLVQALLPACRSDSSDGDPELESTERDSVALLSQSLAIDNSLILVDAQSDRAFIVDLSKDDLAASKSVVDLPANPFRLERREGLAKEALILSAGLRGVSPSTALSVLRISGRLRTYQVSAPFDALKQTEDGRYAVLYYGRGSDRLLSSLNEIAIVDLTSDVDERAAVVWRSVDTPGGPPTGLEVSPHLELDGDEKPLAILFSDSHLTLVDLDDLERGETVIRLSSGEGDEAVRPEQVAFHPEMGAFYLRAANSDDVFVVRIEKDPSGFKTSIGQLTAGTAPSDIAVYGERDGARLLVVSESDQQVHIFDTSGLAEGGDGSDVVASGVVHIDLERTADSVLIYESEESEPSEELAVGNLQQHALLYRQGGETVTFLDLSDAETAGERNLQTVRVGDPIESLEPLEDPNLVLILQESSRIRVLDLRERKIITTVNVEGSLYDAVFIADLPRLWIAPPDQFFAGCVNLTSGDTEEVLLDHRLADFVVAPEPELAVAIHEVAVDEEEGTADSIAITVLDALDPDPDEAVTFDAFLD